MSRHRRPAQKWAVYWNGERDRRLQPLLIEHVIGGETISFCELMLDPKLMTPEMRNEYRPLENVGVSIDVVAEGAPMNAVKHSGVISQIMPHWTPAGETLKYVSRTERYLFGSPLAGTFMYWKQGGTVFVPGPCVFNPEIDGRTVGNMHSQSGVTLPTGGLHVFIDPETGRNAQEQTLLGGQPERWNLSNAIMYLCQALNGSQAFVKNPNIDELRRQVDDDNDLVRNIEIPHGAYLPQALDSLLGPLGYYWFVQMDSRTSRRIVIHEKDKGGKVVSLYHQKYYELFDPAKTNVEACGVTYDCDRLANRIVGRGARRQIEITVELVKAWPADLDNSRLRDLKRSRHHLNVGESPEIVNAYRKWVLNETGAYIGTRDEITTRFNANVAGLADGNLLANSIPRPRVLQPTLTARLIDGVAVPIGAQRGVEVEWLGPPTPGVEDETAAQREARWRPAGNWGIEILEHEGGIYIAGEDIPTEILLRREDAAIRVTATIDLDERCEAIAAPTQSTPQQRHTVTEDIDLDGQFHWREISQLSKYSGAGAPSLAEDDRTAIQEYVNLLRDRFDSVDVGGPAVLEGVDQHRYHIGQRVEGIIGKRLMFDNRRARPTIPCIAGITLDIMQQKTTLHLMRMKGASL
jgi:hypothetical protein